MAVLLPKLIDELLILKNTTSLLLLTQSHTAISFCNDET